MASNVYFVLRLYIFDGRWHILMNIKVQMKKIGRVENSFYWQESCTDHRGVVHSKTDNVYVLRAFETLQIAVQVIQTRKSIVNT